MRLLPHPCSCSSSRRLVLCYSVGLCSAKDAVCQFVLRERADLLFVCRCVFFPPSLAWLSLRLARSSTSPRSSPPYSFDVIDSVSTTALAWYGAVTRAWRPRCSFQVQPLWWWSTDVQTQRKDVVGDYADLTIQFGAPRQAQGRKALFPRTPRDLLVCGPQLGHYLSRTNKNTHVVGHAQCTDHNTHRPLRNIKTRFWQLGAPSLEYYASSSLSERAFVSRSEQGDPPGEANDCEAQRNRNRVEKVLRRTSLLPRHSGRQQWHRLERVYAPLL